ncbi:MAG: hypothetical protein WAQ53_18105 [Thiofilum sp.]|uniref:hypothetical protein n=1 Tax=Thiofilum sp. TaxID=2212733 RepID=UPI0025CE207B|nr:hypothetical protein [Thiofilum sp.]MBK8453670.1 hypothetical protein [Thiofilum sp.]
MQQVVTFIASLLMLSSAQAFMSDYLPIPNKLLQPSFKLEPLDFALQSTQLSKDIKVSYPNEDDLVLSGVGTLNKPWSLRIPQRSYSAYQADLDKNGTQDLVLSFPTMGNGLAPHTHLITLAFDQQGLPVVSEIEGYFEEDKRGIPDLVDTDRDGKAELVYMTFDEGYWLTALYELNDTRWVSVSQAAGLTYPLYTRFTNKPNHKAVKPSAKRNPQAPKMGNAQPYLQGELLKFKWAEVNLSEDIELILQASKTVSSCKPSSWQSTLMLIVDDAKGRRMISLAVEETAFKALLTEVRDRKLAVTLYGQRDEGCSPELIWAQAH